jgi:lipoyl(octanoyl) transferase
VPYAEALRLQEACVAERTREACADTLLLLEHPPVVTVGRSGNPAHVLLDRDELARRGVELHEAGRGGDVTYHGPGQLVGYPVLRLAPARRDAHRYLRTLEEILIRTLARYGLAAGRDPRWTGVWVAGRKIAAIGVRLGRGWVTSHGFALNVSTDLAPFDAIVPCGIRDRGVTSMARELGRAPDLPAVAGLVAEELAAALGLPLTLPDLDAARPRGACLADGGRG